MDSSAGGRSAGSRLEGSLEDVGDVAGATPAASNAHVPTGRSAFVLAFGLAFAAAACYFMSAHTKVGAAVYEALSRSGFTAAEERWQNRRDSARLGAIRIEASRLGMRKTRCDHTKSQVVTSFL